MKLLPLLLVSLTWANVTYAATTVITPDSYFRSYVVFAPNELDPVKLPVYLASVNADGTPVMSDRRMERLEEEIKSNLSAYGIEADWLSRPIMAWGEDRNALPIVEPPPPPANWTQPDFDEQGWVRRRSPMLVALGSKEELNDNHLPVPRRVRAAYFRTYFVGIPNSTYTLDLAYVGGVRVYLNGQEIATSHLKDDQAEGYKSYKASERKLPALQLPPTLLRDGSNCLAIEIRAPFIHPDALEGADRREGSRWERVIPPHARISNIKLVAEANVPVEQAGVAFWSIDPNARQYRDEYLEAGAPAQPLRVAAARNGTFSGMLSVRADHDLQDVTVQCPTLGDLVVTVRTMGMKDLETMATTGGHRGESKWGPLTHFRERLGRKATPQSSISSFPDVVDEIRGDASYAEIPAKQNRMFWVTVNVPATAKAGLHKGELKLTAKGSTLAVLPMAINVAAFTLPAASEWKTDMWMEVSPYAIANSFGVELWSNAHFELLKQAFALAGTSGTDTLIVPILQDSEFGNNKESIVRWAGGRAIIDTSTLDRYLDVAIKGIGSPKAIIFGVMQGHFGGLSIQTADRSGSIDMTDEQWKAFAVALHAHMRKRGLSDAMYWGLPWDLMSGNKPAQLQRLKEAVPEVKWARASHAYGFDEDFRAVSVVYFGMDGQYGGLKRKAGAEKTSMGQGRGWQKDGMFVSNPRSANTVQEINGYYPGFAFRIFPARTIALGYTGVGRMGANYWQTWEGQTKTAPSRVNSNNPTLMTANAELVDFSIKDLFWPAPDLNRIHSSQRFEMLREGMQEAEARIVLESALDSGKLPAQVADRVRDVLERQVGETAYITRRTNSYLINDHSQRWIERSLELFEMAGQVQTQEKKP